MTFQKYLEGLVWPLCLRSFGVSDKSSTGIQIAIYGRQRTWTVKVVFLSSNTVSLIQLLEQGIDSMFRKLGLTIFKFIPGNLDNDPPIYPW